MIPVVNQAWRGVTVDGDQRAPRCMADVAWCRRCRAVNAGGGAGEVHGSSVVRCGELMRTLEATLSWMRAARQRMRHQQSLGGDLISLQQQTDELAVRLTDSVTCSTTQQN